MKTMNRVNSKEVSTTIEAINKSLYYMVKGLDIEGVLFLDEVKEGLGIEGRLVMKK